MILIDNTIYQNTIVSTLKELQCTDTLTYLLKLKNLVSSEVFYTVVNDLSLSPYRYQEFCVYSVTGTTNPLQAQINLPLEGSYLYEFYENPLSGTTETGLNMLENGKLKVVGVSCSNEYYISDINPELVVYQSDCEIDPDPPTPDEGAFSLLFQDQFN